MYSKPLDGEKGHVGIIIVILGFNPDQVTEWESLIVAATQTRAKLFPSHGLPIPHNGIFDSLLYSMRDFIP